jgi:HlyD family secretion protein
MTHCSRATAARRTSVVRVPAGVALILLCACAPSKEIRGHGTLEIDEIDVASLVGGRVARLYVDEGDTVRAGDTLAVLDRGELTANLEAQVAQAERAAAQYRDLRSGPRTPELIVARSELAAATSTADVAETDYRRARELLKGGVVSAAEVDRARSARDAAVARRDAAREQLKLLEAGFRSGQVEAAARGADVARAELLAGRSRAGELVLTAPASGVVLLRNFDVGEVAGAGQPILTLGDPQRIWMRVYVAAPFLPRVRRGAAVEVTVQGVARKFPGRVSEIATQAEFTPRTALTEEERANLVFGVKVRIDPTQGALQPGLPAEATIAAAPAGGAGS